MLFVLNKLKGCLMCLWSLSANKKVFRADCKYELNKERKNGEKERIATKSHGSEACSWEGNGQNQLSIFEIQHALALRLKKCWMKWSLNEKNKF